MQQTPQKAFAQADFQRNQSSSEVQPFLQVHEVLLYKVPVPVGFQRGNGVHLRVAD